MSRSIQPVFWLLFGAGGMLSALIGAVLVLITGIALPLGIFVPADVLSYHEMAGFARHWWAKAFLFLVVSLFLWHGAHRIFHSLHDLGIHAKKAPALACYGLAFFGTVVAAAELLRIGF